MGGALRSAVVGALACGAASACLDRPVIPTEPHSSNLFVAPAQNRAIDKLDLLFMIDNSRSMGDKQTLLAEAVPKLVSRLVVPRCVNGAGDSSVRSQLDEACPAGFKPEFRAVKDIHVAVITSSLGGHGSASCAHATGDDHARLLPSVRPNLVSYNGSGFLAWDPDKKLNPPGETDTIRLVDGFQQMVSKAGEVGCGYESSLEAWYRFLIDPEPPLSVAVQGGQSVVQGTDTELLAQRRAFLRPDSLVAIVMLTDENDCSVRDDGYGYLLGGNGRMLRASSACDKDPNDRCCVPCASNSVPDGCLPLSADPACQAGKLLPKALDPVNLRCHDTKRRFGIDLLHPTSRYVEALTKREVLQRSTGKLVPNPLFEAPPGMSPRELNWVYLAGIVGVPWQDIADDASLKGAGLRYLTAEQLAGRKRWEVLVGDSAKNLPPTDPFMRESLEPRTGTNPITGDATVAATSLNPTESPINGHEHQNATGDDLQYACTFRLPSAEPCDDDTCDCFETERGTDSGVVARNSPLCQPPGGGAASGTQYFGKAYPGRRTLEVLRDIGQSAIVASICPKVLEPGQPGYGYEPAVDALIDQLRGAFNASCLPRPLAVRADAGGQLPCVVVEATPPAAAGACACDAARRHATTPEAARLVRDQLKQRGNCGTATTPACDTFCLCELSQSEGPGLEQCLNSEAGSDTPGYCYVNPYGEQPQGNPALVEKCDATSRQLIRFVGPDTPQPGSTAFIACLGATPS